MNKARQFTNRSWLQPTQCYIDRHVIRVLFICTIMLPLLMMLVPLSATKVHAQSTEFESDASFEDFYLNESSEISDPLERFNRAIFHLNWTLDKTLLVPIAKSYEAVVPRLGRQFIQNFLEHLSTPFILFNNILQNDMSAAEISLKRLIFNTVIGFGFLDPATSFNAKYQYADFGQTLGVWGVDSGYYLMLPILGPQTGRSAIGLVPGFYSQPTRHVGNPQNQRMTSISIAATKVVDKRSRNYKEIKQLEQETLDLYTSIRSYYFQSRQKLIRDIVTKNDLSQQ